MDKHYTYMQAAIEEANAAFLKDEVPIGAVVVYDGQIIGRGRNMTREKNDPTLHAEIVAIRQACEVMGAQRIPECDLYVTLEPCTMCAGAISFARSLMLADVYLG
jgi:tRNA(Arg) A34 adenosine deaminase TadA